MKTDALINVLGDLNQLAHIDEATLLELVEKYPYVQNFKFLLAKKKQLSNNTDDLQAFQDLTRFISDKGHLYNRLTHSECEQSTDIYRSPEIDKIIEDTIRQSETTSTDPSESIIPTAPQEKEETGIIDQNEDTLDEPIKQSRSVLKIVQEPEQPLPKEASEELDFIQVKPFKKKKSKTSKTDKKKKKGSKKESAKKRTPELKKKKHKRSVTSSKKKEKLKSKKTKKSVVQAHKPAVIVEEEFDSFNAWLQSLNNSRNAPETEESANVKKKQKKEKQKKSALKTSKKVAKKKKSKGKKTDKKKKKNKLQHKIDASLERKPAVVSETLAIIMAKQGHIKEAKNIYSQLILLYPEKSSYFADQIKKLD